MSVVQSIEDAGPSRKRLAIEIPAAAVEAETQRVVGEFSRHAEIPGFRKGKVPKSLVKKRFREPIQQEVEERLLPRYWELAKAESALDALLPPEVEKVEFEAESEDPMIFVALVDVRPDVEVTDARTIELPDPTLEVSDDEVGETLEDLRRRRGNWVPVDRAAAQGDLVSIELVPVEGGAADEGEGEEDAADQEPRNLSIEIGDSRVPEELSLAVTGLKEGQETEYTVAPPTVEEETSDEERPEARSFRVKVTAVKERELVDLDDEFAKDLGQYETLDQLKDDIRAQLSETKERTRSEERRRALLDGLRERYPLELPDRVVAQQLDELLRDYAGELHRRGVDVENANIDWAGVRDSLEDQAKKRVHSRLLLDAVVAQENLRATESDLESALQSIAQMEGVSPQSVRQSLDRSGRLGELRSQLDRDIAVQVLVGERDEPTSNDGSEEE
ncbi:MAG: trigger factor [Acidobacteriota bacterium]